MKCAALLLVSLAVVGAFSRDSLAAEDAQRENNSGLAKQTREKSEAPKKPRDETSSDSRPAKRGDPQIFAPIVVEAEGLHCSVTMKSRDGIGERTFNLVGVKALVPYEEQAAAYESAFAKATGYSPYQDVPRYLFFVAERADVPVDPEASLEWKPISNSNYAMKLSLRYAETVTEIADEAYIVPGVLTMPIPSIQPTASDSLSLHSKVPKRNTQQNPDPQHDDEQRRRKNAEDHREGVTPRKEYKMVRFFDFHAKAGQSYRYRIAVVLEDPNRPRDPEKPAPDKSNLEASVVRRLEEIEAADEAFSKKNGKPRRTFYRQTAWSEPSNIVTVGQAPESGSPPESLPTQVKESVRETKEGVVAEWEKQYARQRAVLRWPRELGEDFNAAVGGIHPIETKVDFPTSPRKQLEIDLRHRYAKYVEHLLPELAALIGSRWAPQFNATEMKDIREGRSQGTTDPKRKPDVVHWSPADQKRLLENHFNWSSQSGGVPSTLQVLYAQEDLWVLEAIMRIIRETNGKVQSKEEAVVKAIQHIRIGRDTVAHDREIDQRDPANDRYVDGRGTPLLGGQLRSAVRSPGGDPSLAIAKRLPVSMKMTMDQQHINKLLVACGESHLPLEVRQIRLGHTPLPDRLGDALNRKTVDEAPKDGNQGRQPQTSLPQFPDVTVELDGLIYIYNPVESESSAR